MKKNWVMPILDEKVKSIVSSNSKKNTTDDGKKNVSTNLKIKKNEINKQKPLGGKNVE